MSYDQTALLLPLNGANGGTAFPDFSRHDHAVTAVGNAQTSTAQSQYYGSSALFDGAGDYLQIASNSAFNITGPFYMGFWVRFATVATAQYIASRWNGTTASMNSWIFFYVQSTGQLAFDYRSVGGSTYVAARQLWSPAANTWYHLAVSWTGSLFRLFVDGTQLGADINQSTAINNPAQPIDIGRLLTSSALYFNGHLQDFKFVVGDAVHTANFTPPARLVAPVAGTLTDDAGAPVERRIWVIPRTWPTRMFSGLSDAGDGSYSIDAPNVECARIVLDDAAGTQHNDLIDRVDAAA